MSEQEQIEKSQKLKVDERAESPTTAKALEFDDDAPETSASPPKTDSKPPAASKPASQEEVPPPKPPRPLAPEQQAENTLKEAFPSIDVTVIRAVLQASGGRIEPAFNALLGMSDPDATEPPPPPQPPRPSAPATSTEAGQLAADERYARQLAEHYNATTEFGDIPGLGQPHGLTGRPTQPRQYPYEEERERSFIDDDLPIIRDNIKKGFLETQSTVNKWVTNLRKRIDGEGGDEDEISNYPAQPAQGYASQQQGNRRSSDFGRRSTDRDRYDADPQVLGDDFAGLHLRDNEEASSRPSRPLANPDLFKPTPPRPNPTSSASGRRVSFQEGPPEEIGVRYPKSPSPANNANAAASGKTSKWQPLSAVDPSPVTDNDPFSLGDSDDEEAKKKDGKADDNERLKLAAAEAMSDNIGDKKSGSEKT